QLPAQHPLRLRGGAGAKRLDHDRADQPARYSGLFSADTARGACDPRGDRHAEPQGADGPLPRAGRRGRPVAQASPLAAAHRPHPDRRRARSPRARHRRGQLRAHLPAARRAQVHGLRRLRIPAGARHARGPHLVLQADRPAAGADVNTSFPRTRESGPSFPRMRESGPSFPRMRESSFDDSATTRFARLRRREWIPAFAGMTWATVLTFLLVATLPVHAAPVDDPAAADPALRRFTESMHGDAYALDVGRIAYRRRYDTALDDILYLVAPRDTWDATSPAWAPARA